MAALWLFRGITMADLFKFVDEPAAAPPPFGLRIHHCGMSVPDLQASINWYRDMLGFSVEIQTHLDMVPFDGAFLRRGDARIELFQATGASPLPPERRDPVSDLMTHGVKHMSLEVSDIHAAFAFLTFRGVEVALPIMEGGPLLAGYIRDNSGNLIELVQHVDHRARVVGDVHSSSRSEV
jgi:methylmalonyl-CoA/ethylmalonyl-CoA epimerase